MNTPKEKDEGSAQPHQADDVWPPKPLRRESQHTNTSIYAGELFTSVNWLDAVLGVPAGFAVGFVLYATVGLIVQAIKKPPSHQPEMFAICLLGSTLTAAAYILIGRKYSLFGFTMWFSGVPFYLLMFFLAWCYV